jgi:hypothetical protein
MFTMATYSALGIDQFQLSKLPKFKSSDNKSISVNPDISVIIIIITLIINYTLYGSNLYFQVIDYHL